jgi:dUTPase
MATSLMNDSAYAGHACTHLLNTAESEFWAENRQRTAQDVKEATEV